MMIWQPSREVCGQAEGEVEHVLLVLGRLLQQLVPFGIDDDVAGRAGERALAGALDVDVVAVRDLEHRQAERRLDLAPRAVALDEGHLRHARRLLGAVEPRRRDPRPRIAAPSTAHRRRRRRRSRSPRRCAAASGPLPRGGRRQPRAPARRRPATPAITACVTGRASCFSARSRAAREQICQLRPARSGAGTGEVERDALAHRRRISALPPTATATAAGRRRDDSMPTAAPGAVAARRGEPSGSSI